MAGRGWKSVGGWGEGCNLRVVWHFPKFPIFGNLKMCLGTLVKGQNHREKKQPVEQKKMCGNVWDGEAYKVRREKDV